MRVLLDEYLPRRLKREFVGHDARTVPEMGWASKRNGELLADAKFDVFLTVDRSLSYQQDVSAFDIAVIVLVARSNTIDDLRPLAPKILEGLANAKRGRVCDQISPTEDVAVWASCRHRRPDSTTTRCHRTPLKQIESRFCCRATLRRPLAHWSIEFSRNPIC